MNNVIPFNFESHSVRVVKDEQGDNWFVASDLCKAIELSSHKGSYKHHLEKLDDDERKTIPRSLVQGTPTLNMGVVAAAFMERFGPAVWAEPEIWVVSESGVYALILRSRNAIVSGTVQHRFRKWLTSEVLPSIRKTGSYTAPKTKQQRTKLPDEVKALLMIGKAVAKVPGVNPNLAMAYTLDAIEKTTGMLAREMSRALPSVDILNTATLNATKLGEKIGDVSARSINRTLESRGLLKKNDDGRWELTEYGMKFGEVKTFHKNGHSGYEILWKESVLDVLLAKTWEENDKEEIVWAH